MALTEKFKKDISTLRAAANGEIFLDVKNPKLFKKVRRFYENNGGAFRRTLDDYEMLMEQIDADLETVEVPNDFKFARSGWSFDPWSFLLL